MAPAAKTRQPEVFVMGLFGAVELVELTDRVRNELRQGRLMRCSETPTKDEYTVNGVDYVRYIASDADLAALAAEAGDDAVLMVDDTGET